jgi:signal transduction histidine kinase
VDATGYAVLGLMLLTVLIGIMLFVIVRFIMRARRTRHRGGERAESMLLASALEDAITKLKARERATAARADASERLSGQILASLTSGLIVVDHDARVQIVNPAARRILHVPDDGTATADGVLRDVPALREVVAEFLRTREPIVRRKVRVDRREGAMHLGVTVSPLAEETGPGGAICLFSDLTTVVSLEEQLRLKETLAGLGELTAGLAHEFRNGLATIHGYARLLDPAALPPSQGAYVEGIREETQSLGDIVTKFLNFARPEPLTLAPIDLRSVITRAAEDVPAARITVRGEFGVLDGDEVLLRQAFSNLFRNSVEACATRSVNPHVAVDGAVDSAAGRVRVDVQDNGPGIQQDALERLFQPFFTTRHGGTGLGLAIVQKVTVSHNGTISAANHPIGGAVFHVTFPTRSASDSPPKP